MEQEDTRSWRQLELIGVLIASLLLYITVVGPALGELLPGFDTSLIADMTTNTSHRGALPDTARGWAYLLGFGPLSVVTYMYLRPKLAGQSPVEYWNER